MFNSFWCRMLLFKIRISFYCPMNLCLCFRLVCFLAQNGWMCCSRLSHSWPSVHPIILQTQHNLALVTQLLCFARRFSHVSLLHVRFVWKTGQRCASPSHQTFTSCGTLECGKMQTEAKMMPDFGGGGRHLEKAKRLRRREDNTQEKNGRLNVGKDPASEAIQEKPAAEEPRQ